MHIETFLSISHGEATCHQEASLNFVFRDFRVLRDFRDFRDLRILT
jgi:hypothetical protein